MKKIIFGLTVVAIILFGTQSITHAQEQEKTNEMQKVTTEYTTGKVIDFYTDENQRTFYKTKLSNGSIVDIDSYGEKIKKGEKIFLEYSPSDKTYNFATVYRNTGSLLLLLLFAVCIVMLAGKKGVRSFISLAASVLLLFGGLIPLLVAGYDPIWTTLFFGLCVLFLSIFVTHGFNRQSLVSFIGSFSSILLAVFLLFLVTKTSSLSGMINDEMQLLSKELHNQLNLVRLVSASILIGILGVLDDITITQVAVVRELSTETNLSKKDIFTKALRVGRDHISSLVNTLVFAYLGATLPMIMFVSLLEIPILVLLSHEYIFIEIVRSLVGAIALALAVPVTTWLATYVFLKSIHNDSCTVQTCQHHHD